MGYTNSKLVSYKKISPHKTSPRNHKIDTITIHCMAGNLSVETCGNVFQTRQASSNYGIGSDGRIALYVDEKDRSWATSSSSNDNRAVTIEVANDGGADTGWHVSGKAMKSLIELITDICKRNDIKELKWSTNKSDRVNHKNGCNMTVHRDYAAKSCPGDYLYGKHSYIASEVNKKLKLTTTATASSTTTPTSIKEFKVKVTVDALNIRKEPSASSKKVGCITNKGTYTIIKTSGSWGYLKSGAGWINISTKYVQRL